MISNYIVDYCLAQDIGIEKLEESNIFPIQKERFFILVATADTKPSKCKNSSLFNLPIKYIHISQKEIDYHIKYFHSMVKIYNLSILALNNSATNKEDNSSIIDMVDNIILFSLKFNTSDIHIESLQDSVAIRFRIDGILQLIFTFQKILYKLLSSIIKLFSSLDISQSRLPQNGRFSKDFNNRQYDFRVSTMPTLNGESIVLRILDSNNSKTTLKEIGFDTKTYQTLNRIVQLHQGLVLVTGPTGSGKTTTLYSILNTLNTVSKKIITIEDPIEYNLSGIQQININEDINLDYSLVLKNILRQDPDIIMIGEIRDETALKIAMQAALTGHLVLATLHTKNAADTITRLLDLNAEPYLIASTLKAVISQRLVRKLSINNKEKYDGRIIVSELLECDEEVCDLILQNYKVQDIVKYAKSQGYITLEENGMKKVQDKITSIEEFYSKIKM